MNEGVKELDRILKERKGRALIFQIDLEAAFDSILRFKMFEILREKWGDHKWI